MEKPMPQHCIYEIDKFFLLCINNKNSNHKTKYKCLHEGNRKINECIKKYEDSKKANFKY